MQKQNDIEKLAYTGERYLPELKGNGQLEHLHRYIFACEFVENKEVLDIACGEGYGSEMLAGFAKRVYGVDIAEDIITYAKTKYKKVNLQFKIGSCTEIPLKDSSIDIVVSFETIEHHDQHEAMMNEVKRVLKSGGLLIVSTPGKLEYSYVPGGKNRFHVKELYYDEFKNLLEASFRNVAIYGQRVIFGSGIFPENGENRTITYNLKDIEKNEIRQARSNGILRPLFLIAIASDSKLPCSIGGLLEQPVADSELVKQKDQAIAQKDAEITGMKYYRKERNPEVLYRFYTSRSWRYTAPARKIGNFVRRILSFMHLPRARMVIKSVYFVLPAFIRNSRLIENLKKRFKNKEISC